MSGPQLLRFGLRELYSRRNFVRRGAGHMDTWETFFREKSQRRSRARALNWRAAIGWMLVSVVFLALITAIVAAMNALL